MSENDKIHECTSSSSSILASSKYAKEKAKDIVETYVRDVGTNRLDGTIHPALDTSRPPEIKIDSEGHKWVDGEDDGGNDVDLERYYKDVDAEEQNFLDAMREFGATANSKYTSQIDPNAIHSMDQVWAMVDVAVEKFKVADVKGFWGSLRKAFRKLGENEKAISGWLGLLPTQSNYMSVVCGGLKLILEAAAHLHKLREDIFAALTEIPIVLNNTQRVLAIHKGAKRLQDYSSALYVSTLDVLAHILEYFRKKVGPKALKATLQQSSFGNDLTEKLKTMKFCSEHFNIEATICTEELGKKSYDVGKSTNRVAKGTYQEVRDVSQLVSVSRQEQWRTHTEIMETITENDEADRKERAENKKKLEELHSAVKEIKGLFFANPEVYELAFIQLQHNSDRFPSFSSSKKEKKDLELSNKEIRRLLLSRLNYDKEAIRDDVRVNVGLVNRLTLEDQDRAVHIMKSQALMTWLSSLDSGPLIINGNSPTIKPLSPVSFVSAKLSDALHRAESSTSRVLVVHYFCSGKVGNVCDIVNSLLAQLLKQCFKHVDSLTPIVQAGDFDSSDTSAVCKRFELVLKVLGSPSMVFCIIDGLSHFLDNEATEEEADALVLWLLKLTRRKKHGYVLKLLLTAKKRLHSEALRHGSLREDEVLEAWPHIPKGGGFTDMKWDTGVGRLI